MLITDDGDGDGDGGGEEDGDGDDDGERKGNFCWVERQSRAQPQWWELSTLAASFSSSLSSLGCFLLLCFLALVVMMCYYRFPVGISHPLLEILLLLLMLVLLLLLFFFRLLPKKWLSWSLHKKASLISCLPKNLSRTTKPLLSVVWQQAGLSHLGPTCSTWPDSA